MRTIKKYCSKETGYEMKAAGKAIVRLRNTYGISIVDLAIKAKMSVYVLMLAEKGRYDLRVDDIGKLFIAFQELKTDNEINIPEQFQN